MARRSRRVGLWIGVCLGLGWLACASGPGSKDHFYRLQVQKETTSPGSCVLPGTLRVERFQADALTAGRPLVYQQDSGSPELGRYAFHLWVNPPSDLLSEEFAAYLKARGVAKEVVTSNLRVTSEYMVRGRILRMQHTLSPKGAAVLELELTLVDQKDRRVILSRTYRATEPAGDVPAAVDAYSQEAQQIFGRFVADCAQRMGGGGSAAE